MAKLETFYRHGSSFLPQLAPASSASAREWKAAMIVIGTIIVIAGGAILGRTDADGRGEM